MAETETQQDSPTIEITTVTPKGINKCNTCGEEYERAILAKNRSGSSPEEYYACSRCLSKVAEVDKEIEPADEEPTEEEKPAKVSSNMLKHVEIKAECPHEVGYLRKRNRGSPIPDECLICPKMIECM